MSNLPTLQNEFQSYLLAADQDIEQHIVSTEKISAKTRLSIYSYAYRSRLLEALADSYSVLKIYMGDDHFEQLGYEYIDRFPSLYRSIRWFGDTLPTFLKNHDVYQHSPYYAELALLEWTMSLVFDAADSESVSLDTMAKIPPSSWPGMRLRPNPTLHRIDLAWNVVAMLEAIVQDKSPHAPQQSQTPVRWICWRHDLINQYYSLSESETWAMDAMIDGATFGEICEGLCQWIAEENVALHAASLLKNWVTSGLISNVIWETNQN